MGKRPRPIKNKALYMCHCGCENTQEKMYAYGTKAMVCAEHGEGFTHKKFKCQKCGCDIITTGTPKWCVPCGKKMKAERSKKYSDEYLRVPTVNHIPAHLLKASADAYDCKHRNDCLTKIIESQKGGYVLPCYKCKEYEMYEY